MGGGDELTNRHNRWGGSINSYHLVYSKETCVIWGKGAHTYGWSFGSAAR